MAKRKKDGHAEASDLIARFEYARKYRATNYDGMAESCWRNYLNYMEPPVEENGKPSQRSHLFIPRTYEQVDTTRARLVKSFFSSKPYVDFLPMPSAEVSQDVMAQNELKAKFAAALIDTQLEKNNITKKIYDFYTSVLVMPIGIIGVGWRLEKTKIKKRVPAESLSGEPLIDKKTGRPILEVKEVEVTTWDDNEIQNIHFLDFWADPRGTSSDISTWRFCFHREWLTRNQIEQRIKMLDDIGSGEVYKLDWKALNSAVDQIGDSKENLQMAVGINPSIDDETYESGDSNSLHEVLHYWEPGKYKMLIDRHSLGYGGDNPYWRHNQMPFIVQSYEPLPGEVYGRSMAYYLDDLQQELNTTRNQRIDNVAMVINKGWAVPRNYDDIIVNKPGMIVREDIANSIRPLITPDVTASAYNEETIIKSDMENTVGTPAVLRGAQGKNRTTATEVVTMNDNAGARHDVKIQLYENEIKRLFMLMDCNNQQFMTEPRLVKLGADLEQAAQWQEVYPDDIQGEWDYRPAGANVDPMANKTIRRQQLTELLGLSQNPELGISSKAVVKELVRTYDVRNPEQFMTTEEEIAQQQQQLEAQKQLQEQAQQMQQMMLKQESQSKMMLTLINNFTKNPEMVQLMQQYMDQNPEMLQQMAGQQPQQSQEVAPEEELDPALLEQLKAMQGGQ